MPTQNISGASSSSTTESSTGSSSESEMSGTLLSNGTKVCLTSLSFRELMERMEPAFPDEIQELLRRWNDMTTDLMMALSLTEEAWVRGYARGKERHAFPVTEEALQIGYRKFLADVGIVDGSDIPEDSGLILPN